jgi:hypothetical protein
MINLEGVIGKMKQFGITMTLDEAQATEQLAETILRCLNLGPDLVADLKNGSPRR